jgi:DNA repair protein RadC
MRRIQSLPPFLRPREKLLSRGPEALTTPELFSVLLITGIRGASIIDLSKKIAKVIENHHSSRKHIDSLKLGNSKTAQVLALLELTKRLNHNTSSIKLTSASDVFAQSYDIIHEQRELLLCFYLNARDELLKKEVVAVGSLNRAGILPREILSLTRDMPVASIILVHNHPSGILEPSKEDILFTKRLSKACDILGVKLLDHLIVSEKGWVQINW